MTVLYLASQSPRRRQLLAELVDEFVVVAADIDETPKAGEAPCVYVERLAREKAIRGTSLVAEQHLASGMVVAADTTVSCNQQLLGKPRDFADFRRMMKLLSGREHRVTTAVAVMKDGRLESSCIQSTVWFRVLRDDEITAYWQTGEPVDKAGGYAIQGLAARFVARLDGSYSAIVGLPMLETEQMLAQFGLNAEWNLKR